MRTTKNMTLKQQIYEHGNNSMYALQQLSLNATTLFTDVPIFDMYQYAFDVLGVSKEQDKNGMFDERPIAQYADTLVLDLFELQIEHIEATGALVYNVLMAYWGYLWRVQQDCLDNNSKSANANLDIAVALYVGDGQTRSDDQKGSMLYNLAEVAGSYFSQKSGETEVNSIALQAFSSIQTLLSQGQCNNADGYVQIRNEIQLLVELTNVVLVQHMIHYMNEAVQKSSSSDFVELFSLSLNPQVASCDVVTYDRLVDLTVAQDISAGTIQDAIEALQKAYSCLGIQCEDVGAYMNDITPMCTNDDTPLLAGYQPQSDIVDEFALINRDVYQIKVLMDFGNWKAAQDYYKYGWNSDSTLNGMVSRQYDWMKSKDLDMFATYYENDPKSFGGGYITAALAGTDRFASASDEERTGAVIGAFQSMALYLGIIGLLESALLRCQTSLFDEGRKSVDGAAALLIGLNDPGSSIYGLAESLCGDFDTCVFGGSVSDTLFIGGLESVSQAVASGDCDQASQIVVEQLRKNLLIPIVQVLLKSTVEADNGDEVAKGTLLSFTRSFVPYVKSVNPDGAKALEANVVPGAKINVQSAFVAVRTTLPKLGVDCSAVGELTIFGSRVGVCEDDANHPWFDSDSEIAPTPSPVADKVPVPEPHPDGLAWGRYTFMNRTLAENDAQFSLDIRDMYFSETPDDASSIYFNPSKYAVNGLSNHPEIQSLEDFSTKVSGFMSEDSLYNFYRVALFDDDSFDDGSSDGWPYADAVVQLAVGPSNGNSAQLGAETVTVMEVFMMIAHQLYEAVDACEKKQSNVDVLIDSAVGLWIGREQGMGIYNSGWMMYSIAQDAANFYGVAEGEAHVNKELMDQFIKAQNIVQQCNSDSKTVEPLRMLVEDIIRNLSKPLLQHLLYQMSEGNFKYVELYALAFIPLTISVDEGAFEYLRDRLFQGYSWDKSIDNNLILAFAKVLHGMRFECADLGDVSNANEKLKGLVDLICNQMAVSYNSSFIAAYETTTNVKELARIDLDVHQIDLFMRAAAYKLALSVYTNGRNSLNPDGSHLTLKELTTSPINKDSGDLWTQFNSYYPSSDSTYADGIITEAILAPGSSRYIGASRRQRSESVRRAFQSLVAYVQIVARLKVSLRLCADKKGGQQGVDEAVALYVGSMEGPFSGGDSFGSGQMMYSLAKDVCDAFDKCESHGDSSANIFLLFSLSNMKEDFDANDCDAAENTLNESILKVLPIPVIQGVLSFADINRGQNVQPTNETLAAGDILAKVLLPQINSLNATSAQTIANSTNFDFNETSLKGGKEAVFEAFSAALPSWGIDCITVGVLKSANLSVCPGTVSTDSSPETDTNLGDNLYVSTTNVQDRANIALDIEEMESDLKMGRVVTAEGIYKNGKNSAIYDENGIQINVRSLAAFSTNASETMVANPLFHIFVNALRDEDGKYRGKEASMYANTIAEEMFGIGAEKKSTLASEAAVALNLWMELANELFQTVKHCKDKTLKDEDGVHSIDEAAAYWIGDGQVAGDSGDGHVLYALAETMGDHFGTVIAGQSRANVNILRLFDQAKSEVSLSNACVENPATARRVRNVVNKIISQMVVVNIQALIHFLRMEDERDRVTIYSNAFVPLVSACNPTTFQYLKGKLLDNSYLELDKDKIVDAILSTLPCFDLTCEDVGKNFSESATTNACADPNPQNPLANYKPTSDVLAFSKMDLDVLELDILLKMEAYEAAQELYSYGKHVSIGDGSDASELSLEILATTTERSVVPEYESFKRYFGNDARYADTMIRNAFQDESMSAVQKRAVIVTIAQTTVMYMAILQAVYDSVGSCSDSNPARNSLAAKNWDKAAAFFIGKLEGSVENGSADGIMLWALSKSLCDDFGTCSDEQKNARINEKISTLFFAGRGAISGGSCDELRKAAFKLEPLLKIPLLQASIFSAELLAQRNLKDKEMVQATAYAYAQAILPLIHSVDGNAASTLQKNFPLSGKAMHDGIYAVASAFSKSIPGLGVTCEDVGESSEIDACTGSSALSPGAKLGISAGVILGVFTTVSLAFLLRRKRKKDDNPENKPLFVPSKGELNHTSELLASRTTESSPIISDTDTDFHGNDACDAIASDEDENDEEYLRAIANVRAMTSSLDEKPRDDSNIV